MNVGKTTKGTLNLSHTLPKRTDRTKRNSNLLSQEDMKIIEARRKEEIIFSWRFFDRSHNLFNMGNSERSWFISLLDSLQQLSTMTTMEFRQQSERRGLRVHSHTWSKASARYEFDEEWFQQNNENCLQFSISKANGRVHGFLISNIFYIVWLDPDHNLYPPLERNRKVLEYDYPVTDYEILELKYDSLEQEVEELKEEISIYEEMINQD